MTLQTYMLFSINVVKHILKQHQINVNLTLRIKSLEK